MYEELTLNIDEGTIILMLAAYRLALKNPEAVPEGKFLKACILLIQAEDNESQQEAIGMVTERKSGT